MTRQFSFITVCTFLMVCSGCRWFGGRTDSLFEPLPAETTGIHFSNEITYDKAFNITNFSYIYNGGGVAAGDIDNDGLTDLYFTGNMVSSRLYVNKGNFNFEDITGSSGTGTSGWAGGASMVDLNHDGYLDIYVSVTGTETSTARERKNRLFINNRDRTFTEAAARYGLADTGFTTHAAFFDYDLDGDLDVYLINNFAGSFSRDNRTGLRSEVNDGSSKSADALYRNNGDGSFDNVSRQAGILKEGYSLGIAVSDINKDGYPDVYVSNDIQTDDLLYINNGDGTFTDRSAAYLKHTSYAGMGADIADFNNDSWPDILQVDMLPPSLEQKKQVTRSISYEYLQRLDQQGYQRQYTLNSLQMSNGVDAEGNVIFSEIGQMAGIQATDWSWSGLFGDYDNDGRKDIMITNGYPKAVNNFDYLLDINRSTMFGSDSSRKQRVYEVMDRLNAYNTHNYWYRNNGDLTFTDKSEAWGFRNPSFSYGAAHADFDNDGDLDVAINNINDKAGIYRNRADSLKIANYLRIRFRGDSLNTYGLGTTVLLTIKGEKQYATLSPYRGYQASMSPELHFGLGEHRTVDSLEVFWPGGGYQLLKEVKTDRFLTIDYQDAGDIKDQALSPPLMVERKNTGIDYEHRENGYVDFKNEPLLPRMLSRLGPAVAAGDVNGDGREDLFLGGAVGQVGELWLQKQDGTFATTDQLQPWANDRSFEDTDAAFFDANGDGRPDLYVVSGGSSHSPASAQLQDRLYLNSGKGRFISAGNMLPRMYTSGSRVQPADYDQDGDMDLFVAGRLVPGQYARPAKSYLLRNDGGSFTDVTSEVAPDLVEPGMLTDAEWADFSGDGLLDLVTTGIWMPVRFFKNRNGQFEEVTALTGLQEEVGWWESIEKADLDGDGDIDFVAGNAGLNHEYRFSGENSLHLFAGDFDDNSRHDALLAKKKEERFYPLHGLRSMAAQFPGMRKIQRFEQYAAADLQQLFQRDPENAAFHRNATQFASSVMLNEKSKGFVLKPLPNEAQVSSINDMVIRDINGDQIPDLITAGNTYNTNPSFPRNDAGNGLLLLGDGKGGFQPVSPYITGYVAPGNVNSMISIDLDGMMSILTASNEDSVQVFQKVPASKWEARR